MIFNFFNINKRSESEKDGIEILVDLANSYNPNWYEEAKAEDLASEDEEEREFWVKFYEEIEEK